VGKRSSLHNLLEAGANINNLARGELAPENTLDYLSFWSEPKEKSSLYILCVLLLIEIINLAHNCAELDVCVYFYLLQFYI